MLIENKGWDEKMSDGIPKVSIIIPVYNGEKVLERCLNSVLA